MTRQNASLARLLSRVVHETMDALVEESMRNTLLRQALRAGNLERLPSTPRGVRQFAYGPLRAAVARVMGADVANSVAEEITRVVDAADSVPDAAPAVASTPSGAAPKRSPTVLEPSGSLEPPTVPYPWSIPRRDKPTLATGTPAKHLSPTPGSRRVMTPVEAPGQSYIRRPAADSSEDRRGVTASEYFRRVAQETTPDANLSAPEVPSIARPRVLAATLDQNLVKALSGWLEDRAELLLVRSVFAVLQHIDGAPGVPIYLVLDGQRPGVRPAALAAVAEELDPLRVVLCRSTPRLDRALRTISPASGGWLRLDENHRIDEIAARCLELVS